MKPNISEEEKIKKAYGNCNKCFGKGYSTYMYGTRTSADFSGEDIYTKPEIEMIFCYCGRGKQLKDLIKQQRITLLSKLQVGLIIGQEMWMKLEEAKKNV